MGIRPIAITFLLAFVSQAYAHDEKNCTDPSHIEQEARLVLNATKKIKECPNLGDMDLLCNQIGMGHLNKVPGPEKMGKYMYQQTVYEAACVTIDELDNAPEGVIAKKVQVMWDKFGKHITCEDKGTTGGSNILKYGAANGLDAFIRDIVLGWKLNLNYYDNTDNGRTLLDYIDAQLAGPLGPETRKKFESYRKLFIQGGAKKKSELK